MVRGVHCFVLLFFIIFAVGVVSASFSVKILDNVDGIIEMDPGDEREFGFIVDNENSLGEMGIEARVMDGRAISAVVGEIKRSIPAGKGEEFVLRVEIPEGYGGGREDVRLMFRPTFQEGGSGVQILGNIGKKISILVSGDEIEEPSASTSTQGEDATETSIERSPVQVEGKREESGGRLNKNIVFIVVGIVAVLGAIFYVVRTGKS